MERPTKRQKKSKNDNSDPMVTFASSTKEKSNLLICEASTNTLIGHKVRFRRSSLRFRGRVTLSRMYREDIERQELHMVFRTDHGIMKLR